MSRKSDHETPEWAARDFKRATPAKDLPPEILAAFPKTRCPQKTPTKVPVSLRLSREVAGHFKASGPGWQSRIEQTLRKVAGLE
jgi:uncharacterized protein (DUF4415 family)